MTKLLWPVAIIFVTAASGLGQSGPTLVGAGYGQPSYLTIAPGQILTLQLAGLKTSLPSPIRATTTPLPTVLAGISVKIDQHIPLQAPLPSVPMVAVSQRNFCSSAAATAPDCVITSITIQVPFELLFYKDQLTLLRCDVAYPGKGCPPTDLQVSENGTTSKAFLVTPVSDNLHIVTNCDLDALGSTSVAVPYSLYNPGPIPKPCQSLATHADGTQISADSPAIAGEVVVLYAWGVGITNQAGTTGDVAKIPLAAPGASVQYAFSPNAAPARQYGGDFPFEYEFRARFVGLVQGQVGLYSINVKIPDTIIAVQNCGGDIASNLTITVSPGSSFDGAAICVKRNF